MIENPIKNSDTTIQFYAGLKTIGGTIFEVKYKEERFIADFGMIFQNKEGVQLRPQHTISELQAIGVIPSISGVLKNDEVDRNTTIAISHLHLDHMGLLQYLHPDVPIIMSEESKALYEHLHTIEEEPHVNVARQVKSIPFNEPFLVSKHIQVELFPVNHDVLGASAMRIVTPDTTIVYSGDVRLHEADTDTANLPKVAASPDILIIETTNVQEEFLDINPVIASEKDVIIPTLWEIDTPIIFNIYHRNVKRLEILIEAAKQKDKLIVFEPETAYLVQAFQMEAPHVRFLQAEQSNSQIGDLLHTIQPITLTELNRDFSQVWMQSTYHHIEMLQDLPVQGATYVHSNGVPLGDFDPVYKELLEWIEKLQMKLVVLGVSGHAAAPQIKWLADAMQAKVTIPLHGFTPELLQGPYKTFLPKMGIIYPVSAIID